MSIKIVEDGPEVVLTRSEHTRLQHEYQKAFMMYSGPVPTFEEFVRQRLTENKIQILNELV